MVEARQVRVLIVDDNRDAADLLSDFFLLHGYMTEIEYDGFAGLSAVLAFAPNVVFLDLGMPELDGFETARQIRRLTSIQQPRLVAFSAWGDEYTRAKTKEAGFDAHVVKPSDLNILLAEIERR
jgi:DNA-binding response OmpR family regulator